MEITYIKLLIVMGLLDLLPGAIYTFCITGPLEGIGGGLKIFARVIQAETITMKVIILYKQFSIYSINAFIAIGYRVGQ
ncbi:MAG: hypothetical protein IPP49_02135 [Saprospiraceae bacterium]|nr:hypothetical protein [Saprospiraceae bacterium]